MFGKNAGTSHKFSSDINVQKLTVNSALQLYAVLLLVPDLREGFLNSEA